MVGLAPDLLQVTLLGLGERKKWFPACYEIPLKCGWLKRFIRMRFSTSLSAESSSSFIVQFSTFTSCFIATRTYRIPSISVYDKILLKLPMLL